MEKSAAHYLEIYDAQLRTDAETQGSEKVQRLGPLYLATFAQGQGFITYPHITGTEPVPLCDLVAPALAHFAAQPQISSVEFKTRGHDNTPGLEQELHTHGFIAQDAEAVMIGPLQDLAAVQKIPAGITLRSITTRADIQAMCRMSDQAFGERFDSHAAEELCDRLKHTDGMEIWVAEDDHQMVGAGRLEPVAGSDFAGMWGGSVLPEYRGRGIYRALTAARARSALARGLRYAHSDSTKYSQPILERSGMLAVTTTTPYLWTRP